MPNLSWKRKIELIVIFTCLTVSVGFQIQQQSSHHEQAHGLNHCSNLPIKLRLLLNEAAFPVKSLQGHELPIPKKKHEGDISGQTTHRESRRRMHQWQVFAMDYSGVRRRRPIHNKSLPVGP